MATLFPVINTGTTMFHICDKHINRLDKWGRIMNIMNVIPMPFVRASARIIARATKTILLSAVIAASMITSAQAATRVTYFHTDALGNPVAATNEQDIDILHLIRTITSTTTTTGT